MNLNLPEKFQGLFKPKRIKVFFGGRGGGKTVSIAKATIARASNEALRVLCLREYMNSIDESVHSALESEIANLGMTGAFDVQRTRIEGHNGSLFTYRALARNIASIKSIHDVDVAWVEEAETITDKSLDILIPTIRKPGSEIWLSFNPDDEFGAAYSRFVKPHIEAINANGFYEDDHLLVVKVDLTDNPFAPQELIDESVRMKAGNVKKWRHIFGGECFADYKDSIIQPEWIEAAVNAHEKLGFEGIGIKSLGFDPADDGSDAKALAQRHGSIVTHMDYWLDGELPDAISRAFSSADEWRADVLVYDATGIGRAVKVGLEPRLEGKALEAAPFEGAWKVQDPGMIYADGRSNKETFRNRRAQAYWNIRDRFEATYNALESKNALYIDPANLISLSPSLGCLDVLKSELTKLHRKRGENSFIQIESKEDMRKRGVKSPNLADALMMCFANPAPTAKLKPIQYESEF